MHLVRQIQIVRCNECCQALFLYQGKKFRMHPPRRFGVKITCWLVCKQ